MELKIEHDEYESSLCFSRNVSVEQKYLAQLSGDSAVLSAILQELIANAYVTGSETDVTIDVTVVQLWEAICLLIKDGKQSVCAQEAAALLGWSERAVQKCVDIACKEG